jgi:hypothetical protein
MSQYIHDNTEDEFTHFNFINHYLVSKGADAVDLEPFRTLLGSSAPGSSGKKRLTNLMQLTVDTSWWTRYRSPNKNPDFGDTFPPIIPGWPRASSRRSRDRMTTSNRTSISRPSPTRRHSISPPSNAACIHRSPSA